MIYSIVKKDFILAKKYLMLMLVFAIVGPIFIESKVGFIDGGFLSFFVTAFFIQYMLFNSISMSEYKYKGSLHLCITPYTRKLLVRGKYLFIIITFIMSTLIYLGLASLGTINVPILEMVISLPMITVKDVGISFLIISSLFGVFIPLQYRFGYEKTKYIAAVFTFISPFILPKIVYIVQSKNMGLSNNSIYLDIVPFVLVIIVGVVSMYVSTYIYSKKDLQ